MERGALCNKISTNSGMEEYVSRLDCLRRNYRLLHPDRHPECVDRASEAFAKFNNKCPKTFSSLDEAQAVSQLEATKTATPTLSIMDRALPAKQKSTKAATPTLSIMDRAVPEEGNLYNDLLAKGKKLRNMTGNLSTNYKKIKDIYHDAKPLADAVYQKLPKNVRDVFKSRDTNDRKIYRGEEDTTSKYPIYTGKQSAPRAPQWKLVPGMVGFNAYAYKKMLNAQRSGKLNLQLKCGKGSFAYQRTVQWLTRPSLPLNRMLVVHRTGSGKTRTMISVLINYYTDQRPKIVIVPNQEVRKNFYDQLLTSDNKIARYVYATLGSKYAEFKSTRASRVPTRPPGINPPKIWKEYTENAIKLLRWHGIRRDGGIPDPYGPQSPMIVMSYTSAAGSAVRNGTHTAFGWRRHMPTVWKKRSNPYENKLVLMDEFHNIVTPGSRDVAGLIPRLRKYLKSCSGSAVYGFTATPPLVKEKMLEIMAVIVGNTSPACFEGYISFFDATPNTIYPRVRPCLRSGPNKLGYVHMVQLSPEGRKIYDAKKKQKRARPDYLLAYCNSVFGKYTKRAYSSSKKKTSFVDRVISERVAENLLTKLWLVARYTVDSEKKTVILCNRNNGLTYLYAILIQLYRQKRIPTSQVKMFRLVTPSAAGDSEVNIEFTKGLDIVVLDEATYSEGISIKRADQIILVNPPGSIHQYRQRVGRVLRACMWKYPDNPGDHALSVHMFVAQATVDEDRLERLLREHAAYRSDMNTLYGDIAVDKAILDGLPGIKSGDCSAT